MKQKIKLGIILGVEFIAITLILLLIFFAGKKTYTVTFDLNGGTLISGELVQNVTQGKNATPPTVAKDGCYLRSWSASYKQITHDTVIEAVWEWEIITTVGFEYSSTDNSDYCIIESSFDNLYGDVYVPTHHDNKKILGMADNVFYDHDGITNIHMLDGIISIGDRAFSECDNLVSIELPGTLRVLGSGAFENCKKLERVVFPDAMEVIPDKAFSGCTSLKEIVIPASVKTISAGAFSGCTSLERITLQTFDVVEENKETGEVAVIEVKGVNSIEGGAFLGCDSLVEIRLPATLTSVGEYAFDNGELTIHLDIEEADRPEEWMYNCFGSSRLEWKTPISDEPTEDSGDEKINDRER